MFILYVSMFLFTYLIFHDIDIHAIFIKLFLKDVRHVQVTVSGYLHLLAWTCRQ